ncbi:signal recognition particle, SRP19 subunit, partial [Zopfochytrium polystomum]
WVSVYPLYFDAGQSRAGGRRVVKARAVASPSIVYLVECCRRLGLAQIVEQGKRHPSDALTFGRIKVQIVRDGLGQPVRPDVRNKVELLIRLAEVYAETEKAMKLADPTVAAHAAASRSQVSKVQQES